MNAPPGNAPSDDPARRGPGDERAGGGTRHDDARALRRPASARPALEVFLAFLRVGLVSFGGPVAHIALMREEFVRRRRWIDDAAYLDLIAAANLVPGPTSTEIALHLGARRAGRRGAAAAALAFIGPASLIVLGLAWVYVAFGTTPPVQALLLGVKPVVVAIVLVALVALARTLRARPLLLALAAAAALAWLLGVHELAILAVAGVAAAGGAVIVTVLRRAVPGAAVLPLLPALSGAAVPIPGPVALDQLAAVFLKAGALLFGSGYVLLAFLRADLVERYGWLTDAQLLDAVAVGQVTPGPLFTSATFIGYLLAGLPGAVVATVAIFLPAFAFAALLPRVVVAARRRPLTARVLDGIVAASLGLMAGVAVVLGRDALTGAGGGPDAWALVTAVAALALLASRRAGPTLLIGVGALVGLARYLLAG